MPDRGFAGYLLRARSLDCVVQGLESVLELPLPCQGWSDLLLLHNVDSSTFFMRREFSWGTCASCMTRGGADAIGRKIQKLNLV